MIRHVRLSCSAIALYASETAELELAGKYAPPVAAAISVSSAGEKSSPSIPIA